MALPVSELEVISDDEVAVDEDGVVVDALPFDIDADDIELLDPYGSARMSELRASGMDDAGGEHDARREGDDSVNGPRQGGQDRAGSSAQEGAFEGLTAARATPSRMSASSAIPLAIPGMPRLPPPLDAAAVRVQSTFRGRVARTAQEEATKAATKMQANFRGLAARDAKQEAARKQWLRYYAAAGEWESALELAVSEDEEALVQVARAAIEAPEATTAAAIKLQSSFRGLTARQTKQEEARMQWLEYHTEMGEWDAALALAVTEVEVAEITDTRAAAEAHETSGAATQPSPPSLPPPLEMAAIKLQSSFRGLTARDAKQEAARKQWLRYYAAAGEWESALELAVSEDEEALVQVARAAIEAPEATTAAAIKLQSSFRGLTARQTKQEEARMQWLEYHTEMGEWDAALALAVTEVEVAEITDTRAAAEAHETSGAATQPSPPSLPPPLEMAAIKLQSSFRGLTARNAKQEAGRRQWLEYYMTVSEWESALELAVTDDEVAAIAKAAAQPVETPTETALVQALRAEIMQLEGDLAAARTLVRAQRSRSFRSSSGRSARLSGRMRNLKEVSKGSLREISSQSSFRSPSMDAFRPDPALGKPFVRQPSSRGVLLNIRSPSSFGEPPPTVESTTPGERSVGPRSWLDGAAAHGDDDDDYDDYDDVDAADITAGMRTLSAHL